MGFRPFTVTSAAGGSLGPGAFALHLDLQVGGQVSRVAACHQPQTFLILLLFHHVWENDGEDQRLRVQGHTCLSRTSHFLGDSLGLQVVGHSAGWAEAIKDCGALLHADKHCGRLA